MRRRITRATGPAVPLFWLTLAIALGSPSSGLAQESTRQTTQEKAAAVARRTMSAARYCTLVTLGDDGVPQARIIDPLEPDAAFAIHVATNPRSRKVGEINLDPRVTLLYFDPVRLAYVTVIGRAVEIKGDEKARHFKKEWEAFFARAQPETYTLYRIVPSRLEVVSAQDGLTGDAVTGRPEIIHLPPR